MIKKIAAISFSPTGSTRDLVDKAAETLAGRLKLPLSYDSFTLPKDQKKVRRFTGRNPRGFRHAHLCWPRAQ